MRFASFSPWDGVLCNARWRDSSLRRDLNQVEAFFRVKSGTWDWKRVSFLLPWVFQLTRDGLAGRESFCLQSQMELIIDSSLFSVGRSLVAISRLHTWTRLPFTIARGSQATKRRQSVRDKGSKWEFNVISLIALIRLSIDGSAHWWFTSNTHTLTHLFD